MKKNKFKKWLFKTFREYIIEACKDEVKAITQYKLVSKEAEVIKLQHEISMSDRDLNYSNTNHMYEFAIIDAKQRLLNEASSYIETETINQLELGITKTRIRLHVANYKLK